MKDKFALVGSFVSLFVATLAVVVMLIIYIFTAAMIKEFWQGDGVVVEDEAGVGVSDVISYIGYTYERRIQDRFLMEDITYHDYSDYEAFKARSQNSLGKRDLNSSSPENFDFYGNDESLSLISSSENSARILFSKDGVPVDLELGAWHAVDVDLDGLFDLDVKLISVDGESGFAELDIKRYSYLQEEALNEFDGVVDSVEFEVPVVEEDQLSRGEYGEFSVSEDCCGEKIFWDEVRSEDFRLENKFNETSLEYYFEGCDDFVFHKKNMVRSFDFLMDNTPLRFSESFDKGNYDIFIECSKAVLETSEESGMLIAGTAGTKTITLYTRLPSFGGIEMHELLHVLGFGHFTSGESIMNPALRRPYCSFENGTELFLCDFESRHVLIGRDILNGLNSVYGGSADD